jgi:hypothetical protein
MNIEEFENAQKDMVEELKRKELYEDAINTYGEEAQIDVMNEEMSELMKALLKLRRFEANPLGQAQDSEEHESLEEDVISEIVDVQLMLNQMKFIFCSGFSNGNKYNTEYNRKVERLRKRLVEFKREKTKFEMRRGLVVRDEEKTID